MGQHRRTRVGPFGHVAVLVLAAHSDRQDGEQSHQYEKAMRDKHVSRTRCNARRSHRSPR